MKKTIALMILSFIFLSGCAAPALYEETNSFTEHTETAVKSNIFEDYDYNVDLNNIKFNDDPDMSNKPLPESYCLTEYYEPTSFSNILSKDCDILVVDVKNIEDNYSFSFTGNSDLDDKLEQKWGSGKLALSASIYEISILSVISSDTFSVGETVRLFNPNGDWGVSLKDGEKYMIVTTRYQDDLYKLYSSMNSVFDISDDFIVTSQSAFKFPSKLDGLTLAEAATVLKTEKESLK